MHFVLELCGILFKLRVKKCTEPEKKIRNALPERNTHEPEHTELKLLVVHIHSSGRRKRLVVGQKLGDKERLAKRFQRVPRVSI